MRSLLGGFIVVSLLLFSSVSWGAQVRFANDNAEVGAVISSSEVSRIALFDDRIRSVTGLPAGFSVEHDPESGDVFLVPLSHTIGPEIINLFIVSEAGYTYQMLLQLRDIPSEQILIRNPDVKFSGASADAPRHEEIASLLRATITGEPLKGFRRFGVSIGEYDILDNFVSTEVWQGKHFRAVLLSRLSEYEGIVSARALAEQYAGVWVSPDGVRLVVVMEVSDDQGN